MQVKSILALGSTAMRMGLGITTGLRDSDVQVSLRLRSAAFQFGDLLLGFVVLDDIRTQVK